MPIGDSGQHRHLPGTGVREYVGPTPALAGFPGSRGRSFHRRRRLIWGDERVSQRVLFKVSLELSPGLPSRQ